MTAYGTRGDAQLEEDLERIEAPPEGERSLGASALKIA
jgi:hypothetical protein